jgi:hypothetical protein
MQSEEWMLKLNVCGQTERVWTAFQGVRGEGDDVSLEYRTEADTRSWTQSVFLLCIAL